MKSRLFAFLTMFSVVMAGILLLGACRKNQSGEDKSKTVARVFDSYLYQNDLEGLVPPRTAVADSLEITNAYINNWVRQKLLLKQAEDNLDFDSRDFEKQIEQYRNSLIIFAYETELVKQKLDTTVTSAEIAKYYEENLGNYVLHENIVQASYVISDKNNPLNNKIKALLVNKSQHDKLIELCSNNNIEFHISDGQWMPFTELCSHIPLKVDDQEIFLSHNKYYEVSDSTQLYFVSIEAYKGKESVSPLAYEADNIRSVILNKRKAELLQKMEDDLYNDAVKKKNYEIYQKK